MRFAVNLKIEIQLRLNAKRRIEKVNTKSSFRPYNTKKKRF